MQDRKTFFDGVVRLLLICAIAAFAGCSDDQDAVKWQVDDPGIDGGAVEDECTTSDQCGEDAYCHIPSSCTAPRYCADGFPPYSAAPGFLACSCDGRVTSVNAGYPGRHAWQLQGAFGTESVEGECAPDAEFPVEYVLRLEVSESPEDLLARLSWRGEDESREPVSVPDDGVLTWQAASDGWPRFSVTLLRDLDGDGLCSPGDEVYGSTPEEVSVDLLEFEYEATLRLNDTAEGCDRW